MTTQPALFTDPRVPSLERELADALAENARLEAELDRMAELLEWRTAWADHIDTCGDQGAAASGPSSGAVNSLETSGAGVLATPDPVGHSTGGSRE